MASHAVGKRDNKAPFRFVAFNAPLGCSGFTKGVPYEQDILVCFMARPLVRVAVN
jgi:hypothetical protein